MKEFTCLAQVASDVFHWRASCVQVVPYK